MKIKALVVDDEALSRDELKYLLGAYPWVDIVAEAADGDEAVVLCQRLQPDVIFLDIQMPGRSGLAVAREILQQKEPPVIIFATAYDRYAIEAFEINALDYLLKPFSMERLGRTVERLNQVLGDQQSVVTKLSKLVQQLDGGAPVQNKLQRLAVEVNESIYLMEPQEIVYAYFEGRSAFIKTKDRTYQTNYSLQELENRLPQPPFFRSHRGYLVNLDWVKEVRPWFNGAYQLVVGDREGSEVPVSRLCSKKMKGLLGMS